MFTIPYRSPACLPVNRGWFMEAQQVAPVEAPLKSRWLGAEKGHGRQRAGIGVSGRKARAKGRGRIGRQTAADWQNVSSSQLLWMEYYRVKYGGVLRYVLQPVLLLPGLRACSAGATAGADGVSRRRFKESAHHPSDAMHKREGNEEPDSRDGTQNTRNPRRGGCNRHLIHGPNGRSDSTQDAKEDGQTIHSAHHGCLVSLAPRQSKEDRGGRGLRMVSERALDDWIGRAQFQPKGILGWSWNWIGGEVGLWLPRGGVLILAEGEECGRLMRSLVAALRRWWSARSFQIQTFAKKKKGGAG